MSRGFPVSPSSIAAREPHNPTSLGQEAEEQESLCPHSEEDTKAKKGYLTRPMSHSPSEMSPFNLRKGKELSPYLLLGPLGDQEGPSCTEFPSVHVGRPYLRPQS